MRKRAFLGKSSSTLRDRKKKDREKGHRKRQQLGMELLEDRRLLATLMVNQQNASSGDGRSWAAAFTDLQEALDLASTLQSDADAENDIDQIWIAEGTYRPSELSDAEQPRSATFSLIDGVTLYGGFAGSELTLAERDVVRHATTLSGDIGVVGDISDNAYSVVTVDSSVNASLASLVIRDGNADYYSGSSTEHTSNGGGVFNAGSLTLNNVVIERNLASRSGSGIYSVDALLNIQHSSFIKNEAGNLGGGLGAVNGAVAIVNSTFTQNQALRGGGVYVGESDALITNSTFESNSANLGGGVYATGTENDVKLNNTIVTGSTKSSRESSGFLEFCDSDRDYYYGGFAGYIESYCSRLGADVDATSTISGSNNLIGNGDGQTSFVNGEDGNFVGSAEQLLDAQLSDLVQFSSGHWGHRPQQSSPAVDSGNNVLSVDQDGNSITKDAAGNARIFNTVVDRGAIEMVSSAPLLTIADVVIDEGDTTADVTVFVELTHPASSEVTADFSTYNGTAFAGEDFEATSGSLTIPIGETTGSFTLPILGDSEYELDKEFFVRIEEVEGAENFGALATVRLLNDDSIIVDTLKDTTDPDDGVISLREALTVFPENEHANRIEIAAELYENSPAVIPLDERISVSSDAVILGPGPDRLTTMGSGERSIFDVQSDTKMVIDGMTITGGYGTSKGSAINNYGQLTMSHVKVVGNYNTQFGSAVYNSGESLTISNSVIVGNSYIGVTSDKGKLSVENSTIAYNGVAEIGNSAEVSIVNSIVWGDDHKAMTQSDGRNLSVVSSLIDIDPKFVRSPSDGGDGWGDVSSTVFVDESANDDYGDLRLQPFSPGINSGLNAFLPVDHGDIDRDGDLDELLPIDFGGASRVFGDVLDIGAYEFNGTIDSLREPISLVVTTEQDVFDLYDGDISVRDAIFYAGINGRGDRITFDPSLDGKTILLNGSSIVIDRAVTLDASSLSAGVTFDAERKSGVFQVLADSSQQVELIGVTITGGLTKYGAGVVNRASLSLTNSIVRDNEATTHGGGIYSAVDSSLSIVDTSVADNAANQGGGGIYSAMESSPLTIVRSEIKGNSTESNGAGIYAQSGNLSLLGSTLVGNSAAYNGGAIYGQSATVLMVGSTIVGNSSASGGGISMSGGSLRVQNSSIVENAGGSILNYGSSDVVNSIVWQQEGNPVLGMADATVRNSLIGIDPKFVRNPSDGGDGWGDDPATDATDESSNDDFGDLSLTDTSPAIDIGSDVLLPADSLDLDGDGNYIESWPLDSAGNVRSSGVSVDAGAYEFQGIAASGRESPSVIVTTELDALDFYDGEISLREAIGYVGTSGLGTTITFSGDLDGKTIVLGGSSLQVDRALTIDASTLAGGLTIDAAGKSGVLNISADENEHVELIGLSIVGGSAVNGAGIANRSTLKITSSTLSNNSASSKGGGVYSLGPVSIMDSQISANTAGVGGAIHSVGQTMELSHVLISANSASGSGGGVYTTSGTVSVEETTIGNNLAGSGGGVYAATSNLSLATTDISSNSVSNQGGGIYFSGGTLSLNESTLSKNSASNDGGGLYAKSSFIASIDSSILTNSSRRRGGGGFYVTDGKLDVFNSSFLGNRLHDQSGDSSPYGIEATGGAVHVSRTPMSITNSVFVGNFADDGGSAIQTHFGNARIANSTFVGNVGQILRNELEGYSGGTGATSITNSIVWGNSDSELSEQNKVAVSSSLINVDPKFVRYPSDGGDGWGDNTNTSGIDESLNDDFGDLRLTDRSPAIDFGDNSLIPVDGFDLDDDQDVVETIPIDRSGNPRVAGNSVDVGAFEFGGTVAPGQNAGSLIVDTVNDSFDLYDGVTSLREAIFFAETDDFDTSVTFDTSMSGQRIVLDGSSLLIRDGITIDGSALTSPVTIDGDGRSRVFTVAAEQDQTVQLIGLAITGGSAVLGGGIYALSPLTISTSTLAGNTASQHGGGIYHSFSESDFGVVSIDQSAIHDNSALHGGGIYNASGRFVLTNSQVQQNTASSGDGGGIYALGSVDVVSSSLTLNDASRNGGGIYNYATSSLVNSIVLANRVGGDGGGIYNVRTLSVQNSTVAHNEDLGIHNRNTLQISNSILWNNETGEIEGYENATISNSLIGIDPEFVLSPTDGGDGWGDDATTADVDESANDELGDLRLAETSPAIDFGDQSSVPLDHFDLDDDSDVDEQMPLDLDGNVRTFGTSVDAGAYETQSDPAAGRETPSLIVNTTSDSLNFYDGFVSIRDAIRYAKSDSLGDTITFDPLLSGQTITLSGNSLWIDSKLTINTAGLSGGLTIDGDGNSSVFSVVAPKEDLVQLSGITIIGGSATKGGGIFNTGTLSISDATISDNSASDSGGGIHNLGVLSIDNTTVSNNTADGAGGGIDSFGESLVLDDSIVEGNYAARGGGGVYVNSPSAIDTSFSSRDSEFLNNSVGTSYSGGGLYLNVDEAVLVGIRVEGNTARSGGAIYSRSDSVSLTDSVIAANSASSFGGGIYHNNGDLTIDQTEFRSNENSGLYQSYGTVTIKNSSFFHNTGTHGAGVYKIGGSLLIADSTIAQNSASSDGGGLYTNGGNSGNMTAILNSKFVGNSASEGGAIHVGIRWEDISVVNSEVIGNRAYGLTGGGIYNTGMLSVIHSVIAENEGSGIISDGELALSNSILWSNVGGDLDGAGIKTVASSLTGIDPKFVRMPNDGGDGWGDDLATTEVDESANDDYGDVRLTGLSPAIDLGNDSYLPVDSYDIDNDGDATELLPFDGDRNPRVFGDHVDIGPYEYQGSYADGREAPSLVVTTDADVFDFYDGLISIREAVFYLNSENLETTITFASSLSGSTISLSGSDLLLDRGVTIDASALAEPLTINGNTQSRIFNVIAPIDQPVELIGLTITGGLSAGGGAIANFGTLTITDSTLEGNAAGESGLGGAIYNLARLSVRDSTVQNNSSSYGGGIYNDGGVVNLADSAVTQNSTSTGFTSQGGGIYNKGTLDVLRTIVSENIAEGSGGGIYHGSGSLRITSSEISDNRSQGAGGAVYHADGALDIRGSEISNNQSQASGGGILAQDAVSITSSTVVGNTATAGSGGGVYSSISLTATNSVFTGNFALYSGGGIYDARSTNYSDVTTLQLDNSVVSANDTGGNGGGIYLRSNAIGSINNSTIAGNLNDGVFNDGELSIENSILWDNGQSDVVGESRLTILSSLIGIDPKFVREPSHGGDGWGDNLDTTDVDESANDDYGDVRLSVFSPAVDYGSTALLPTDKYDVDDDGDKAEPLPFDLDEKSRIFGSSVDAGAFELQEEIASGRETPSLVVSTNDDLFDLYDGVISLREAVYYAHFDVDPGRITFSPQLSGSTIELDGNSLLIDRGVTIDASALANGVTIDAGLKSRVFTVSAPIGQSVELIGLTITGGSADVGGGILNRNMLTLSDVSLHHNTSTGYGGGIHTTGNLSIGNSHVSDNVASRGAGIHGEDSNVSVTGSFILGNSASQHGGGINSFNGDVTILGSDVSMNVASSYGGGVALDDGTFVVEQSTISQNTANSSGGGVYFSRGSLMISQTEIIGNSSNSSGGGLHARGQVDIESAIIGENIARSQGAGLYNSASMTMRNTLVSGNVSTSRLGGGIYNLGDSTIESSTIAGNRAKQSAGGISTGGYNGSLRVTQSIQHHCCRKLSNSR